MQSSQDSFGGGAGGIPTPPLEEEWSYLLDPPSTVASFQVGALDPASAGAEPASPVGTAAADLPLEPERPQQFYLTPNASEKD